MSFLSHTDTAGSSTSGTIDYRMARQWVIDQYNRGRLARHDVCDAHPELRRAATSVAEATKQLCPICKEENVVLVTYVFGPRLPAFGRCITSKAELRNFAAKAAKGKQYTAYIVEVCPGCWWNHLAQMFLIGRTN